VDDTSATRRVTLAIQCALSVETMSDGGRSKKCKTKKCKMRKRETKTA